MPQEIKKHQYMKYITLFRRAALPALMAAALCACTDRTEELGGDDGRKPDLGQITPAVVYNAPEDIDGPVRDIADGMTFYFARNDYEGRANRGTVCAEPIPGTIDNNLDGYNILFNPVQYYDGKMTTQMQGWYPEGGVYDEGDGYPEVEFEIDGSQDIMMSNVLEGTMADRGIDYQERDDHRFVFEHKLTQLQFYVKAESQLAMEQWGEIKSISIPEQQYVATLILGIGATDPEDAECSFGRTTTTLTAIMDNNVPFEIPLSKGDDDEGQFAGLIMLMPQTLSAGETTEQTGLLLDVETSTGRKEIKVSVKNTLELLAGHAHKAIIEFKQGPDSVILVPTEWRKAEVDVAVGKPQPYVRKGENYIVSRGMFGDAADYTIRDDKWTDNSHTGENSIPAILEVSVTDLPQEYTWTDAQGTNPCSDLGADWRLPSLAEMQLIQQYKGELDKEGTVTPTGIYWTLYSDKSGYAYTIDMDGSHEGVETAVGEQHKVRCVRDIDMSK